MNVRKMLGIALVLVVVIGALALTGCSAASPFKAGDPVAAKWSDNNLWLATVVSVSGDKVTVQFNDDHSTRVDPIADVHLIEKKAWAVGDSVQAVWATGRFYPGTITAANGDTYTVKWQDSSSPTDVTSDKIIAAP